jgi:hypothetical protein
MRRHQYRQDYCRETGRGQIELRILLDHLSCWIWLTPLITNRAPGSNEITLEGFQARHGDSPTPCLKLMIWIWTIASREGGLTLYQLYLRRSTNTVLIFDEPPSRSLKRVSSLDCSNISSILGSAS